MLNSHCSAVSRLSSLALLSHNPSHHLSSLTHHLSSLVSCFLLFSHPLAHSLTFSLQLTLTIHSPLTFLSPPPLTPPTPPSTFLYIIHLVFCLYALLVLLFSTGCLLHIAATASLAVPPIRPSQTKSRVSPFSSSLRPRLFQSTKSLTTTNPPSFTLNTVHSHLPHLH